MAPAWYLRGCVPLLLLPPSPLPAASWPRAPVMRGSQVEVSSAVCRRGRSSSGAGETDCVCSVVVLLDVLLYRVD